MSLNNTGTTAVEKYFEQRVVTSGDPTTLTIDDVHIDSTSKEIIVHGHIDTEHLELTVSVADETSIKQDFLSWLYITDDGRINPTHRVDDHIELVFDDETETFTHVQTGCELTPSEVTTEISDRDIETITSELRDVFTRFSYELTDPPHDKDNGLLCEVSNISDPDGDSFILTTYPAAGVDLHWELQIPHVSEISNSSLEVLIEEEGGGNPEFIADGGEIVILHESDTTSDLDVIGFDESGEWGIIPPSTHESWDETEDTATRSNTRYETNSSSTSSTSSTESSSSTSGSSPSDSILSTTTESVHKHEHRKKGQQIIVQSMMMMGLLGIMQVSLPYATTQLPQEALSETNILSLIDQVTLFLNALVILSMFYGVFLFVASR